MKAWLGKNSNCTTFSWQIMVFWPRLTGTSLRGTAAELLKATR
jgi:hypothetical protein